MQVLWFGIGFAFVYFWIGLDWNGMECCIVCGIMIAHFALWFLQLKLFIITVYI